MHWKDVATKWLKIPQNFGIFVAVIAVVAVSLAYHYVPSAFLTADIGMEFPTSTPTSFIFLSGPYLMSAKACSPAVTVQAQNPSGTPVSALANATVQLLSQSTSTLFFSDSGCTQAATSVTIAAGQNSASFYFTNPTTSTWANVVASATDVGPWQQVEYFETGPGNLPALPTSTP